MSERMNIRLIELLRMCDTPTFNVTIQSTDCIGQRKMIAEKQPLNEIRLTTLVNNLRCSNTSKTF